MFESEMRQVDRAAADFEAGKKKLFRPDGSPMFVDDYHRAQMAELTEALDEVLNRVDEVANEASRKAQAVLGGNDDPRLVAMDRLSEADLERAYRRRPFIEEDARHLSPDALAERIGQVMASGDRALGFLFARYAGLRVEAEAAAGRADSAGTVALSRAVNDLWGTFKDPKAPQRRQEAQETREAVRELWRHVRQTRTRVTGHDPALAVARQRVGVL